MMPRRALADQLGEKDEEDKEQNNDCKQNKETEEEEELDLDERWALLELVGDRMLGRWPTA